MANSTEVNSSLVATHVVDQFLKHWKWVLNNELMCKRNTNILGCGIGLDRSKPLFYFVPNYKAFLESCCSYYLFNIYHRHSLLPSVLRTPAAASYLEKDWKAVQRCTSKTDHLPIWINTKYTIQITELTVLNNETWSSGINWDKYFLAIWNKYINTFLNIRQTHFAIWDKYI